MRVIHTGLGGKDMVGVAVRLLLFSSDCISRKFVESEANDSGMRSFMAANAGESVSRRGGSLVAAAIVSLAVGLRFR